MKLICYLSNGFPTLEQSARLAEYYAQGGCDIIEIDLPSRNPYLESEFIANRMATALKACDDYDRYMDNILEIRRRLPNTKLLILSYGNTVEEIGVEKYAKFCVDNDMRDIIFVGLENEEIKNELI
ncbi:MAG: tryptophan synthase subunit alpha, partial [Clostridiales bacterium]|nr:tryptophan synthase subunit alpha [Clostridiales bacterium]